jgi:DNA-binding NtrC family response regulator
MEKNGRILILDEERNHSRALAAVLSKDDYEVVESQDSEKAIEMMEKENFDVVLTEENISGRMDGMQLFEYIKANYPEIPVIFFSSYGTVDSAVHALTSGAFYYFVKPADYLKLKKIISQAVEQRRIKREVERLRQELTGSEEKNRILGKSKKMLRLFRTLNSIGKSKSSVLITGGTGTGKELVARDLHRRSNGRGKPFVAVNCAAIPRELLEAELFGYEKGSFTGATSRRIGKIEEACGGTLFLDEIGEFEISLQAKLLRVLQEKEIERIGSEEKTKVHFRLICATNGNLMNQIEAGTFREDLYYRINVFHIHLPPLRERSDDIPLLVSKFLKDFCRRENKAVYVSDEVMEILMKYNWPGNVRELRNVVERAVVLVTGDCIQLRHLPLELQTLRKTDRQVKEIIPLKKLESTAIHEALRTCNGNKSKTAKILGISRKALYKRLNEYQSSRYQTA